ncbi:hypothetical protein COCCADRAFT_41870 [Bipolaris zeicola 26-R-13]|uniref:Uncharacterized protein n=1 Tax=Cochliobolus carbonum (strain 26-R-13) TaxID=930089 RepID=W6XQ34_COCC2|nr:uncharacterized protein COCCADRAFT_41870 [Bipolaris zeicola 26-R-13]EUC27400.1 hypothetical protein COCCADRAFT_41870 [Bipolaris zeicola 26-R-13]
MNVLNSIVDFPSTLKAAAPRFNVTSKTARTLWNGSLLGGSLVTAFLVNQWLSRRALNGGNAPSNYDWDKEVILVTGGAGGIGKKMHYYKCDITSYSNLQAVAARIREEVDEPTVAIANAGICRGKPVLEASKEAIELTFGVNNLAVLWTAKAFMPSMIKNNHSYFLIVASQAGYTWTPGLTDYSATKSAAVAIYEGLYGKVRYIHKSRSVRVSCVSPGAVDTKMFAGIKLGLGMSALIPEYVGTQIPDIILAGRARNVFVLASAGFAVILLAMPDWIRAAMQVFSIGVFANLTPHNPMKGQ